MHNKNYWWAHTWVYNTLVKIYVIKNKTLIEYISPVILSKHYFIYLFNFNMTTFIEALTLPSISIKAEISENIRAWIEVWWIWGDEEVNFFRPVTWQCLTDRNKRIWTHCLLFNNNKNIPMLSLKCGYLFKFLLWGSKSGVAAEY